MISRNNSPNPRSGEKVIMHTRAESSRDIRAGSWARLVMSPTDLEYPWMARALALAERGRGHVEPNPLVGAVLVRDGQIVGEGWHERFGGAHAEVNALSAAGEKARG